MVHSDGPQCADTTAVAGHESAAGQRFLIGDASLGSNPLAPANQSGAWRFYPQQSKKCPPMGGFCELVAGRRTPNLAISGSE